MLKKEKNKIDKNRSQMLWKIDTCKKKAEIKQSS